MMDIFTLLAPLVTASLPVSPPIDFPDAAPTRPNLTHFVTGLPVAKASEVYSLTPARHFCRVFCPFCGGEHSHGVDLAFILHQETARRGFGPRKAHCTRLDMRDGSGGDYWIEMDEWVRAGSRIEDKARLKEGELIWL